MEQKLPEWAVPGTRIYLYGHKATITKWFLAPADWETAGIKKGQLCYETVRGEIGRWRPEIGMKIG